VSRGSGASPRSARTRLTAAARSPAVSASVPSRSNRTARTHSGAIVVASGVILVATTKRGDVVDRRIPTERVASRERVIGHADYRVDFEFRLAGMSCKLRRLQEPRVVVCSTGQQPQCVLCAKNRQEIGFGVAVDGRENQQPTRLGETRTRSDSGAGMGNVL